MFYKKSTVDSDTCQMSFEAFVKNRTLSMAKTFEQIDKAKGILQQLESYSMKVSNNDPVDLAHVVNEIHALREVVDKVLVSFVEAMHFNQER